MRSSKAEKCKSVVKEIWELALREYLLLAALSSSAACWHGASLSPWNHREALLKEVNNVHLCEPFATCNITACIFIDAYSHLGLKPGPFVPKFANFVFSFPVFSTDF